MYSRQGRRNVSIQVSSDEAFVYLRLNGACVECLDQNAKGERVAYAFALSTLPDRVGLKQMPFPGGTVNSGANFLVTLASTASGKVLIADNYNPYHLAPKPGVPNETELVFRRGFTPEIDIRGTFQELVVETNRRRFARDGTVFPGQRYSRSQMRYIPMADRDKDSLAEWYTDPKSQAVVVRIPWGKLLVTDPSSRRAFAGFDSTGRVITSPTIGIQVTFFELKRGASDELANMSLISTLPEKGQEPKRLEWKAWEKVALEPYFKKSYYVMQKEFQEPNGEQKAGGGGTGPARTVPAAPAPARAGKP